MRTSIARTTLRVCSSRVPEMAHYVMKVVVWVELLVWSGIARLLVSRCSLSRSVRALDWLPTRSRTSAENASFPDDRQVRLAGACLGQSLARSQYLRTRGISHSIVIGTRGGLMDFNAHAWISPFEECPEGFVEIHRIER
jgi:hypothetical protein